MQLIDTHCHLTDLSDAEVEGVIARAAAVDVTQMLCVGASKGKQSAVRAVELARSFPEIIASVGFHPHDAGEFVDLSEVEELASAPKVVAIGETGLDFFRDWSPFENQYKLFAASLDVAENLKKPVIIHCRAAEDETLRILSERRSANLTGVFHCFSGDLPYAQRILDLGFLISLTGTLTFKSTQALRDIVRALPLDRLMLETDAPYMAPEPHRGKPSEPQHVRQIAEKLAQIKGITVEEVAAQTTANARRLFSLET